MMTRDEWAIPGILSDLIDFAFRPVCLICRKPTDGTEQGLPEETRKLICFYCYGEIKGIPGPVCRRCGSPGITGNKDNCGTCHGLPEDFGLIRSASLMEGVGGKLVHLYKYQGWKTLAGVLALNIVSSRWSDREFWDADLLLPVPISLVRRRERGYNQSEILAEEISALVGIPVGRGFLERVSWKRPQVGLSYEDRLRNVFNAFHVPDNMKDRLTGGRVIIVDDVITTGATIHACYQALVKGRVGKVSCVSFGRAENHVEY